MIASAARKLPAASIARRRRRSSPRTRHFFNGLTEEVRKVSVGTHGDGSFAVTEQVDTTSTSGWSVPSSSSINSVYDEERYGDVLRFAKSGCTSGNFASPSFSETKRVASFWIRNEELSCPPRVGFYISTSAGARYIELVLGSGTDSYSGGYYLIRLDSNIDGWQRIERDIQALVSDLTPGVTVHSITRMYTRGHEYRVADVRFSNSLTVEKNVLGGGSIGHILRNRTIDPETYEATDRWFHYNQVGSVVAASSSSGNLVTRRFSDAFGNAIDQSSMAWLSRSAGAGWGHNTKEHDAKTGFVYMYQRWYMPETGTFLSTAPYPPMMEHPYGFAAGNPVMRVDPDGRFFRVFKCAQSRSPCIANCATINNLAACFKWCEAAFLACKGKKCDLAFEWANPHMVGKTGDPRTGAEFFDCDCEGGDSKVKGEMDSPAACRKCRLAVRALTNDDPDINPCCD